MLSFKELLLASQPLLIFFVIGVGYLVGQLRIKGIGLGIAGVLFVGLAIGAWLPATAEAKVQPMVMEIGLILFVYAVGLSSGPGFFRAMKENGLRFNLAVIIALVFGAALALGLGTLLQLSPGLISGAYCGGLTNTPALAATTQLLKQMDPQNAMEPTLGYSVSYPFGVLAGIMALQMMVWWEQKAYRAEKETVAAAATGAKQVVSINYEIRNPELFDHAVGELRIQQKTGLILSRILHNGNMSVPTKYTRLCNGDIVLAVGSRADHASAEAYFGALSTEHLELQREQIEMRRILVSDRKLSGLTIEQLNLEDRFNAQITRLRRADLDIVPTPLMTIELGDRLRVVMPRDRVTEVTEFFGDSEREVAELDYTAITMGISMGVLVGMIPIPMPGGGTLSLGFAGGPLMVALVLGKLGRSGPVVWSIPHEANMALRHIGLLLFLAGVGVTAGGRFLEALRSSGWQLFVLGFTVTMVTTALTMILLRRFSKASVIGTLGATSGMQTQPATLAMAHELSRSDEVYVTYATTYPVAMIGKIILSQIIVVIASRL